MLDVLIAMIIMVVGFILIWSSMASKPNIVQPYFLAQDTIDFLSTTIADVSSTDYVNSLITDGNITSFDTTIFEQIALFYYENNTLKRPNDYVLRNFTRIILQNSTPSQYSSEFSIDQHNIFYQQNPYNKPQNDSDSLVSAKTIVSVVIDKSDISPPYVAEIRVWQ